jgi:hypothetical protein
MDFVCDGIANSLMEQKKTLYKVLFISWYNSSS